MVLERIADRTNANEGDHPVRVLIGEFTTETRGDTLHVTGDVDLYVAAEFRQAGETLVRDQATPRIDLTEVAFLDSAGLAALLSVARLARSCNKTVRVIAIGNPRRVLRITGVDRMLTMED